MLTHLTLRDFAVAAATELHFGPGLTVVSGETGAGKSLIVDALGFLSGARADSGVVRHGAARAELSAAFAPAAGSPARAWLADNEFDDGDDCQLRRTLRADGGSRAWINGRPATLAQLAELAAHLVGIHGQHEHQALMSRPGQLALLDGVGGHAPLLAKVREAAARWSALLAERAALAALGDVSERRDWLAHQHDELERDALSPAEYAELGAAHRRHANAGALVDACDAALAALGGDGGEALPGQLHRVRAPLARLQSDEPRLAEVDAMLDAAAIQFDEAALLLARVRDDLDADPARFDELERRLARLHELARKHRVAPDALAAQRDVLAAELESLRGADDRLAALAGEIDAASAAWASAAAALTRARAKVGKRLAADVGRTIATLGMGGGRFEVALEPVVAGQPDPQGAERVEFLVSANAGQPPRPLRKVASGGELSRLSLAIEVAALGADPVPTMVFDEVDAGIGGAVADVVGHQLRALAGDRQVLCVTHLPQVAAKGHAHWRVSKADAGGMTQSQVERLDDAGREAELARMLGGVKVSAEARAAAARLLAEVDGAG